MHQPESAIPQNNRQAIIGCLFVLLGALGFSAKAVLIKLAYGYDHQLDAITLMLLRMAISLPFFLAVALWSAKGSAKTEAAQRLNRLDWLMIFGLGILGYYIASLLDFAGLQYISAGLERLILFLYPTFVVLFTAAIQRRAINRHQALALALSYAGMILVFVDNRAAMASSGLLMGSALVLASAITFALFLMGSGMMVKRIGSTRFTAYSMTVACLGDRPAFRDSAWRQAVEFAGQCLWAGADHGDFLHRASGIFNECRDQAHRRRFRVHYQFHGADRHVGAGLFTVRRDFDIGATGRDGFGANRRLCGQPGQGINDLP